MSMTIEAGLSGGVLGSYKYCGGVNETARRAAIINGPGSRIGRLGMKVTRMEGLKSWKDIDKSAAKKRAKKASVRSAAEHDMTVQSFDTPAIQPSPTGRLPRSKKVVGTADAVTDDGVVEVKTTSAPKKRSRAATVLGAAATLLGLSSGPSARKARAAIDSPIVLPAKRAPQTPVESRKRKPSMGGK